MPPPKQLAKPPEIQPSTSQSNPEQPKTASGLDQEAEDQFELELCWCIQQLQTGLMDVTLQEKQAYNMTKSLNMLKSNNASLIRKRQVMRNTFGDYRSKMAEDEKKFGKAAAQVKFTTSGKKKKQEKKSLFIKRACSTIKVSEKNEMSKPDDEKSSTTSIINSDVSNKPFKFNFSLNDE